MTSLKNLKAAEAIKAFEKAGGIIRYGKGDHVNIKIPNGRIITLRSTGEVKQGLLIDSLREAGLTKKQFLELLK
jgi:predicted RNA binding protein YcfA (HicA-like mRNA interferase family)